MIPDYQSKPERRLTYKERVKAGLVQPKKRAKLRKVAKSKVGDQKRYIDWIRIAMHGVQRCEKCKAHVGTCGPLEIHHPHGRFNEHLFQAVPLCSSCHRGIHEEPSRALKEGWISNIYRGTLPDPTAPVPFTLLPPP